MIEVTVKERKGSFVENVERFIIIPFVCRELSEEIIFASIRGLGRSMVKVICAGRKVLLARCNMYLVISLL